MTLFFRPNRQFRFEERDKDGIVKGQYGYYDKDGKFRMMNYLAHPENGFRMEPAPESEIKEQQSVQLVVKSKLEDTKTAIKNCDPFIFLSECSYVGNTQ